ncbi:acetoin dehydrogenase dihydrolipoyllysine-residue acetyltransferase subunit [Nordella sp. HKS 07]|uniref:acetoin dehydrogenase dihydrolipoyllysine-residue acetyltransferase subunit n=1 Tax=Nordella sp. HKS 07 TaxID=2712222 RepID=UPI0013E18404|nr:acetoin dehydrogenase dihydrolipoyllysine-residue acetyltransferase subunit [Nordella sp. HKS 07]QIG51722.1 acetoin dehydrogenase dihydrolipoyllysine-residue acetyltransferase subunit [Nordella sp. HKS 07]
MTKRTLTMPRLGETMDEGTIVGWLVAPGQKFQRGAAILEIETDKTVVEFPALGDGTMEKTLVSSGDRVTVGAPIAEVTVTASEDWESEVAGGPAPANADAGTAILAMPRLGETMTEGVIIRWLVAEGADYARGDAILEIETDKTAAEVPALSDGKLVKILAAEGTRQPVGAPIAEVIGEVEAPVSAAAAPVETASAPLPKAHAAVSSDGRRRATPLARRLARSAGISLDHISGSGRRGRIERRDVESAIQATASPSSARIAFDKLGDRGETFLLIHGFAGDRSSWVATASGIARAGHTAIVPDLPAHGVSKAEAASLDDLVAAMSDFAASLPGALHLVGHSLGGAVATGLASRLGAKVKSLTLIAPAGTGREIDSGFILGMAAATTAGEVAHLLRLLGPKADGLSDAAVTVMAAQLAQGRLKALAQALVGPAGQKIDILRALAKLADELPVRALIGTEDRTIPAAQALNLPPSVAVHFLAAGHMPHWDLPRETLSLITGVVHG